ncbi:hypothetical protein ARMGADRAFT_1084788 [Armillaria gallica]|uniref:Uncharacterized protein n=1 Tax=Armillaria gallica TaxID=47427 RepID=A0A2H3CYS1_ARMGA|nr:hypothetical protein ARMGADRAFT_1084788 [Armillaria gallica]
MCNSSQVASIVNLLYKHSDAVSYHNLQVDEHHFTLPLYALAPTLCLQQVLLTPLPNSIKNTLMNSALSVVMDHVNVKSTQLAECPTFVQDKIATIAPALFALTLTCGVSKEAREQLKEAANNTIPSAPPTSIHSTEPAPINVTPTTAPACDSVSSGVPKGMHTDLWLGVTVTLLALLHLHYMYAIIFPTVIGIFLFTCNVNRDIISMSSRMGMSIAYSTILSSLHVLASDTDTQLRTFDATLDTTAPTFQILFDNVNKMRHAWQQLLGHRDKLKSGTVATLVKLEDITPGALEVKPLFQNIAKKE